MTGIEAKFFLNVFNTLIIQFFEKTKIIILFTSEKQQKKKKTVSNSNDI